mmetsp:Transcript_3091/g.7113  ORF Transcript_3091/g.7113 Transcript_3091/m.7113 type:complete len:220 (+) Transcript_3091:299-958(+)
MQGARQSTSRRVGHEPLPRFDVVLPHTLIHPAVRVVADPLAVSLIVFEGPLVALSTPSVLSVRAQHQRALAVHLLIAEIHLPLVGPAVLEGSLHHVLEAVLLAALLSSPLGLGLALDLLARHRRGFPEKPKAVRVLEALSRRARPAGVAADQRLAVPALLLAGPGRLLAKPGRLGGDRGHGLGGGGRAEGGVGGVEPGARQRAAGQGLRGGGAGLRDGR